MKTYDVFVNADDVYSHSIVARARSHDEALTEALLIMQVPFSHVISAVVTPQPTETEFHGARGCGMRTFKELFSLIKSTNVRAAKKVQS